MKYLFTLLNCLFVVTSAYFCVDIVYKKVVPEVKTTSTGQGGEKTRKIPRSTVNRPNVIASRNKVIWKRNLFRVELEKKGVSGANSFEQEPEELEPTHLKLALWGTVTGGEGPYAVIEDKKVRLQSLYLVGDTVQGAKVKKILRQKVVLSFQGKDQILEMEMETHAKKGSLFNLYRVTSPGAFPAFAPVVRKKIETKQLLEGSGALMRQIKFRPHYTKGEPDGLMVFGIRPNSIFSNIGLRNGDIVKQINETPIASEEDAASIFSEIINSDQSKLTLFRRGKVQELVYEMKQQLF